MGSFCLLNSLWLFKCTHFSKHTTALTLIITEPRHSREPTCLPRCFLLQPRGTNLPKPTDCSIWNMSVATGSQAIPGAIPPKQSSRFACSFISVETRLELAQICIRPIYTCSLYRLENTNSKAAAQGMAGLCYSAWFIPILFACLLWAQRQNELEEGDD